MSRALRENIDSVGQVDWTVRDFHGYEARRGTTYNAYLVRDDKTALIDTVKEPYAERLLRNVAELTDLSRVNYIVCNHAEPDHAGALAEVIKAIPGATLLCNKKCQAALAAHHDIAGWKIQIVATGDSVSLGNRSLQFIDTPMVHWPESMFTYIPEEKLLFSMDAFGQHWADSRRFDDEAPLDITMEEAKSYYANIVMPYGKQVAKVLNQLADREIEMIAPSHGLIWRKYVPRILEAYRDWSVCRPKPKVLVIYDTMWDSTGRMAQAVLDGASVPGVETQLIHVRKTDLTRIVTEIIDTAAVAFGSPTLNSDMMPMAAATLTYIKGLRPTGKVGFAFGSYGWGRGGPEAIDEFMKAMKWETLRDPLRAQYRPTPEILDECRKSGKLLAQKAIEMTS
jgi:flavorubredoxin